MNDGSPAVDIKLNRRVQAVLSQRQHRYLIRQLCWVLTIGQHYRTGCHIPLIDHCPRAGWKGAALSVFALAF
jgi:hypothetical protein